ncbi:transcriptional regulator swi6 [Coemansia sp. S100]|nr:transcriptional regulator swi6 [Coemansia sp. S100]KAJ2102845.1 transcriptional regulator swi6 [Coemansia sp. S142-1]
MSIGTAGTGVYVAVYSGIQVYEMECRGIAVMKRLADSWLNATQILKVAGIDKGRRTKILEREVLTGEHEKIQGGYGKYQGTWVPNGRGVELCRHYMVHEIMRPILEYDPTASGTQPDQTPTKAELKKLLKSSQKTVQRAGSSSQSVGLKRERSEQQAQAGSSKRLKAVASSAATSPLHSDMLSVAGATRGDSAGLAARCVAPASGTRATAGYSSPAGAWEEASSQTVGESASDIRAKHDRRLLMNIFLNDDPNYIPEWLVQADMSAPQSPVHDSDLPLSAVLSAVAEKTLKIDVDLVIDDQGHTAVHWAATLARIQVLDLLLFQGADVRHLNFEGESALVRAVQVTNNYDSQTFPDLLELLHETIPLTDRTNRTVLHHIAIATGTKGREKAARYYADCLLSWIVRLAGGYQVDHSLTDDTGKALPLGPMRNLPTPTQSSSPATRRGLIDTLDSEAELLGAAPIDPARNADFVAFLNLQDINGDTALNLAARYGDRSVIRMILEAGASPTIPNTGGICPLHFGVGELAEPVASMPYNDDEHHVSSSPTPATRYRAPVLNSLSPPNGSLALPQTPSRLAAVRGGGGAARGLLSSPAHANSRTPNGNGVVGPGEVWSPASAELRMHQSVQNIQQIMSELEADFSGEMRIKQEHFDEIKRQLRNTTMELARARDTIHQLHAKAEQLDGVKSRVGYLEETLARETIAVRAAISALPSNSKPRMDLEALLEALLASPDESDPQTSAVIETDAGLPLIPSVVLDGFPLDAELDDTTDPAKLAALVEKLRVINQVYAKRDALLRERVAVLRRRADVSERERQYRQIIASCCEISEADVDIWIDRLVSAVESTDSFADDNLLSLPATANGTAPHTQDHASQAV